MKTVPGKAAAFAAGLPMSRERFAGLFDYLDEQLEEGCDDTLRFTLDYLQEQGVTNVGEVREWLARQGARCDCEVLANVEERFGE